LSSVCNYFGNKRRTFASHWVGGRGRYRRRLKIIIRPGKDGLTVKKLLASLLIGGLLSLGCSDAGNGAKPGAGKDAGAARGKGQRGGQEIAPEGKGATDLKDKKDDIPPPSTPTPEDDPGYRPPKKDAGAKKGDAPKGDAPKTEKKDKN